MRETDLRESLGPGGPEPKSIAAAVADDPKLVSELVKLFLTDGYRISKRASNVFMTLAEKRPEVLAPHIKVLFRALRKPGASVAIRRNVVRLLQDVDVPKGIAGEVFSDCLERIVDPREAIATRAFAIRAAARIAESHAELRRELSLVLKEVLMQPTTPALRNRARKYLED